MTDLVRIGEVVLSEPEQEALERFSAHCPDQSPLIPVARCRAVLEALNTEPPCGKERARGVLATMLALYPGDPIHTNSDRDMVRIYMRGMTALIGIIPIGLSGSLPMFVTQHHRYRSTNTAPRDAPNVGQLREMINAMMSPRSRALVRLSMMITEAERRERERRADAARAASREEVMKAGGLIAHYTAKFAAEGQKMPSILLKILKGHEDEDR